MAVHAENAKGQTAGSGQFCSKCSAWLGHLGLEPTVEMFVQHFVEICREIRRVLRPDGTFWLNIGDSYNGSGKGRSDRTDIQKERYVPSPDTPPTDVPGLKPKDLIGVPWRVAFALQEDGWWLRNDLIWAKGISGQADIGEKTYRAAKDAGCDSETAKKIAQSVGHYHGNSMPNSAEDRCAMSHEYIFLLTKSSHCYFDIEAIREPKKTEMDAYFTGLTQETPEQEVEVRNPRSVWAIATQGFKGAHFATFPIELAARAIRAGTSEKGCCPQCGAPYKRFVEQTESDWQERKKAGEPIRHGLKGAAASGAGGFKGRSKTGEHWEPTCKCDAGDPVPCVVLDPFMGAATTAAAASNQKCSCVGFEICSEYAELAAQRFKEHLGIVGEMNDILLEVVEEDVD